MIHYSGLWGLCFSHHHPHNNHPRYAADTSTEGVLRYLASEDLTPLADFTVTTHHFDADALLSVWAFLNPQQALEKHELLTRIARCGDFFLYLDEPSAQLNFIVEALLVHLRKQGQRGARVADSTLTQRCFAELLPRWDALLDKPADAAELWRDPMHEMSVDLDYLSAPNRVTELWDQHTSVVETDHRLDKHALNSSCHNDLLLVWRHDVSQRHIQVRPAIAWYDLRSLPHYPHYDLERLAKLLNAAEHTVGQSNRWQHHASSAQLQAPTSGLSQEAVVDIIKAWLDEEPEEHVSATYRADVKQVFQHWRHPAIQTSHTRFADHTSISFTPGAAYQGLHTRNSDQSHPSALLCADNATTASMSFAVSDDFYWNRQPSQALELSIDYEDLKGGRFWVEYDAWQNPFQPTRTLQLSGDGTVQNARFRLMDARFGNSQDGGDFRLICTPGSALAIRKLVLRKF